MWREGLNYDEAYSRVKAARGVANPNIGFTCQLLQWQKRRHAPPTRLRLYRIAPHCQRAPLLLVSEPHHHTPPWPTDPLPVLLLGETITISMAAVTCFYCW